MYVIGCSILGIALACGKKAMSGGVTESKSSGGKAEEKQVKLPSVKDLDLSLTTSMSGSTNTRQIERAVSEADVLAKKHLEVQTENLTRLVNQTLSIE